MQREPSLEELIERLRLLNIEAARVNQETAQTVELIGQAQRREQRRHVRETAVTATAVATPVYRAGPPVYRVGDRVIVLSARNDRQATVTRVTNSRIYYRTEGGQDSWRAPHNLRLGTENHVD